MVKTIYKQSTADELCKCSSILAKSLVCLTAKKNSKRKTTKTATKTAYKFYKHFLLYTSSLDFGFIYNTY